MSDGNTQFKEFGEFITDAMARFHVPGAAVGVIHDGQEFTAGFGVTNVNHPLPVDADTLFQIGSITKTFTGTLAMRLVEMGRLDLDAPVRAYLPDFRLRDESVAARVTLRHLFTHMGGWLGDYFDDLGNGEDALAKYVAKMIELPQLTPLGSVWSYNNAGFAVAGRIIEVVTGQPYEAALQEMILKPLGMTMSFIMPTDVMTHRFAAGHLVENASPKVAHPWPLARSANCVGGIVSTVKELLRYARFHMGDGCAEDGTRLLTPESLALMQAPITNAALDEKMGLTFFLRDVGGTRFARHGGGTLGQISEFRFAPERKFALTVLTNADRGAELHSEVTKWALAHYLGLKDQEPTHREMTAAQLAEYVGQYTTALGNSTLALEDDTLMFRYKPKGGFPAKDSPPGPTPPPSRFAFIGADRIIALDPPIKDAQGEFLREADGRIAWFRFGGRIRAKVNG